MNLFVEGCRHPVAAVLVEPRVAGIAHGREQPGACVAAVKAVEEFECAQVGLLHHVPGVLFIARQPAGQIIRCVHVRHYRLFETLQFIVASQR